MKKLRRPRRPTDRNDRAYQLVQESVADRPLPKTVSIEELPEPTPDALKIEFKKKPHAVALGKLGGPTGGRARAANLSPERRAEIAKKAAAKRWGMSEA